MKKNEETMKKIGDMEYYTFEELKDKLLGIVGTPERDEHERMVAESVRAYRIGEAIKMARIEQHLTQEELGERIGVKKSQISKLEHGADARLSTMSRVFKALGLPAPKLNLGLEGEIALW